VQDEDLLLGTVSRNVTVTNSIVYADDNLVTFFSCITIRKYYLPFTVRTIAVVSRMRGFDSLNQFTSAVRPLIELGFDLNQLDFIVNNAAECNN
jgi:hypothetical protein